MRWRGSEKPSRRGHVIVVRDDSSKLYGWGAQDTVLISRKPFTASDIDRAPATGFGNQAGGAYICPAAGMRNEFASCWQSADPAAFWRDYQFDVSPVNDDRPFFFYTVQPRDVWKYLGSANKESADYKINRAVPLLFELMAVSLAATALILALAAACCWERTSRSSQAS